MIADIEGHINVPVAWAEEELDCSTSLLVREVERITRVVCRRPNRGREERASLTINFD